MNLKKVFFLMKEEIQNLATGVKEMVEKVGKVLEVKSINTLYETNYQCDHCSFQSKTEKGLKCHITKKDNIETLRTAYVDTSLHLSSCGVKIDDSLDSDSDDKSSNCLENIAKNEDHFYRLEFYENVTNVITRMPTLKH